VEVSSIAVKLVIIAGFFQLSDGVQCVALGNLRGIEDVNIPTLITLFAYWIVGLPVAYALGFYYKLDVEGVWYGLSVALTISAVLLTIRFYMLVNVKRYGKVKKSAKMDKVGVEVL